ncbi:unnamed protein product [marine sediment metagenome]|uniref:Uncharacterized protein n=1 Tax=marine sediment metagenome TaxID=412755 RepID=X0UQZ6_9ZZZZ
MKIKVLYGDVPHKLVNTGKDDRRNDRATLINSKGRVFTTDLCLVTVVDPEYLPERNAKKE